MDFQSIVQAAKASGVVDAKTGRIFGEAFAASLQADPSVKTAVMAAFAAGAAAVANAATIKAVDKGVTALLLNRGRAAIEANAANAATIKAAIMAIEAAEAVEEVVDVTEHYLLLANLPPVPEKAPEVPAPEAPAPAPAEKPAGKKAARQPAAA
jgi:hypothetical protein